MQFLNRKKNITVVELDSLDLDASNFVLFPTVKFTLRGTHFTSAEEVLTKPENLLKDLPKISFQNCYQQWQHRMQMYVNVERDYFEGDNVMKN
ncbi:hypothetical protein TNCV_798971 [Trichonephila clavipes]|nr:hypothetical protein TNCV_798971 [Trichonephila clavipes]